MTYQEQRHRICYVEDERMPEGHDFLLVIRDDGGAGICYRASIMGDPVRGPRALEDSWTAYRVWLCEHQARPVAMSGILRSA